MFFFTLSNVITEETCLRSSRIAVDAEPINQVLAMPYTAYYTRRDLLL